MNQVKFLTELSKLRPGSTFLTLKGYRNQFSEIADYSLCFHISYENALKRSLVSLESIVPLTDYDAIAKKELTESFSKSLDKSKSLPEEEMEEWSERFYNCDNEIIKGVKRHKETGVLYIFGLINAKKVILPGNYPTEKKQRPLTIAKDRMRRNCPVSRFRMFKILPEQVDSISVDNLSLLPPGAANILDDTSLAYSSIETR